MLEMPESRRLNGMQRSPKEKSSMTEKENFKKAKDKRSMKDDKLRRLLRKLLPWRKRRRPTPNVKKSEPRLKQQN